MHIETLDGTQIEIPADVPQQYPYQVQQYAAKLAETQSSPQVFVVKWDNPKGPTERKYYSPQCWQLETFALEMFEELCKSHDWYYDYSDDHNVWKKGRDSYMSLQSKYQWMLTKCPEATKAIWDQYCKVA